MFLKETSVMPMFMKVYELQPLYFQHVIFRLVLKRLGGDLQYCIESSGVVCWLKLTGNFKVAGSKPG